ncbi:MAG: trypsin-like serine protease [Myxococcota bacterium]
MAHGLRHSPSTLRLKHSQPRTSTLCTALTLGLFSITLIQIAPSPSEAVLIDSGDGSGNITAPANDPGFARMAVVNNQTAVYLENGWLLTAYHVGIGNIELDGTVYDPVPGSRRQLDESDPDPPDLALIKLKGDPGFLPIALAAQTPGVGSDLILIGHGRTRGTATSWSGLDGWNWAYPYTTRWGTNRLTSRSVPGVDFPVFSMEFDAPGSAHTAHEAAATQGDSGGGVFHQNGGSWEVAGILFAVSTQETQPPLTSLRTNLSVAVDVAAYRSEILSIIQVPDCSNGLDDDLDGQIDVGADPGCDSGSDVSEQSALLECDNGIDDDGDSLIDYPLDPECFSSLTPSESLPLVPMMSELATLLTVIALAMLGLRFTAQSKSRTR